MLKKIFLSIGNVVWLLLFGWWSIMIIYSIGIICCLTFFLKPWGLACFHLARGLLSPFGKSIVEHHLFNYQFFSHNDSRRNIGDPVWLILFGVIGMSFFSICLFITVISIVFAPFGFQFFKIAYFLFDPINLVFVPIEQAEAIKIEKNKLEIKQQREATMGRR